MSKVCYVLLADGFEEVEALAPIDLLRRAGCTVYTVSMMPTRTVIGSHGISVLADLCVAELSANVTPDMLFLPGGMPGSKNLDNHPATTKLLEQAVKADAYIAAICAAPFVLGKRGLLAGKHATCYPGFDGDLQGATVEDAAVVADGKILTASAMGAAEELGLLMVAKLFDAETAEKICAAVHPRKQVLVNA